MENNFDVEIIERDPRTFHFHPSNPRDHSDEAVATLAESIQEDPLYFRGRPVLLSDRTGELVVIGGEGRTRAALLLGLDTVPSVVFHGLDEESEVRIMQKDNSHSGKWNDAKLNELAQAWGAEKLKSWAPDVKWSKAPASLDFPGLPDELKGRDLTPGEHEKIVGDDKTAFERIIVVYEKSEEQEMMQKFGIKTLSKVVYRFNELFKCE